MRLKPLDSYDGHSAGQAFLLVGALMSLALALAVTGGFAIWVVFQLVHLVLATFRVS